MENIFDKKSENIRNYQVLYQAFYFENERTIQVLPKGKSELQYATEGFLTPNLFHAISLGPWGSK